jgi:hypothetical protein
MRVGGNLGRCDVVVHSEKVGRIELALERREARQLPPYAA